MEKKKVDIYNSPSAFPYCRGTFNLLRTAPTSPREKIMPYTGFIKNLEIVFHFWSSIVHILWMFWIKFSFEFYCFYGGWKISHSPIWHVGFRLLYCPLFFSSRSVVSHTFFSHEGLDSPSTLQEVSECLGLVLSAFTTLLTVFILEIDQQSSNYNRHLDITPSC